MPDKLEEIKQKADSWQAAASMTELEYRLIRVRIPYLLRRVKAAEAALEASIGLYRGEVGAGEMQTKMDTWEHIKEEA